MFYIVRIYAAGSVQEYRYNELKTAQAYMRAAEYHAELYVWMNGREEFMESVN